MEAHDFAVVGIGQCCWDYLLNVESYPVVDTKTEMSSWTEQGGGPVATALVTLARLGVPCRFHGIVGDDELAVRIRESFNHENISTEGLIGREDAASQVAFVVVEQRTGRRTVLWQRPTGSELRPEELEIDFLDSSCFLLLDGLMAEVSLHAAHEARKRGIPVMIDAGRMRPGMQELCGVSDYVVAAEQLALDLGWDLAPEPFAAAAREVGAPVVCVTRGAAGSITWCNGEVLHVPAFKVDAVDTTGAGDVFHGGFAYGVLQGWPLREVVLFASAVAAMKCTKQGGRTGIPSLAEVTSFLRERGVSVSIS